MKKTLIASIAAIWLAAWAPPQAEAYWNSPEAMSGYPWLLGRANNFCPKKFFEGPLYNYGPYYGGPGYASMYVQNPFCGAYIPANPYTYYPMNPYYPYTWGYSNPGIPGSPGSMGAYPVNAYPGQAPYAGQAPYPGVGAAVAAPSITNATPVTASPTTRSVVPVEVGAESSMPVEAASMEGGTSPGFFKSLRSRWHHN